MNVAVIADVHANLSALRAVLEVVARRGVDLTLCLGDVVGYHAQPNECVDLLASTNAVCVAGNHDQGALGHTDPHSSRAAAEVQAWTGARLSRRSREFLARMPTSVELGWATAVHGCLINPRHVTGYITPTTAEWNLAWLAERHPAPHVAFFGHTHIPAVHTRGWSAVAPPEGKVQLPRDGWTLCNPGAVGQPRDGDPRASFALFDLKAWTLEFVRVAYDIDETVHQVEANGFDPALAARLREGR